MGGIFIGFCKVYLGKIIIMFFVCLFINLQLTKQTGNWKIALRGKKLFCDLIYSSKLPAGRHVRRDKFFNKNVICRKYTKQELSSGPPYSICFRFFSLPLPPYIVILYPIVQLSLTNSGSTLLIFFSSSLLVEFYIMIMMAITTKYM